MFPNFYEIFERYYFLPVREWHVFKIVLQIVLYTPDTRDIVVGERDKKKEQRNHHHIIVAIMKSIVEFYTQQD